MLLPDIRVASGSKVKWVFFGTVLLRVYSGTILPIFIEIGSHLTDKEQKISWHSFFRDAMIR